VNIPLNVRDSEGRSRGSDVLLIRTELGARRVAR
jgi:hypothetical protein